MDQSAVYARCIQQSPSQYLCQLAEGQLLDTENKVSEFSYFSSGVRLRVNRENTPVTIGRIMIGKHIIALESYHKFGVENDNSE